MNQHSDPDDLVALAGLRPQTCVEFFGLPGSGKTTIAREVHAILSRRNPEMVFAPQLLRDEAGAVARAAAKLRLIVAEVARNKGWTDAVSQTIAIRQPRVRDSLRAVLSVATVGSLYANFQRRNVSAVLDQGLLQALWSVQLKADNGQDFRSLVAGTLTEAASSPRIHVAVETPQQVCVARLGSRVSKHSRMQGAEASGDRALWETAEHLRRTILADLGAVYQRLGVPDPTITVDGTADPVVTAGQIADALLARGTTPGEPRAIPVRGVAV
jgi:RecA/RadA recombinase